MFRCLVLTVVVIGHFSPPLAALEKPFPELPHTIISAVYIRPGSMPDRIGVRRGDILTKIAGMPIERKEDNRYMAYGTDILEKIEQVAKSEELDGGVNGMTLAVIRGGEILHFPVPEGTIDDDWEIMILMTENILPGFLAGPNANEKWNGLVERSVRLAAMLDWSGAAKAAQEAVDAGLNDPAVSTHLAGCYGHFPDYEKAEKYYLKALKLQPQNSAALAGLARIYTYTGRPAQALDYFSKVPSDSMSDRYNRNTRGAARSQQSWVREGELDARRRKLGILPNLLAPGVELRVLPFRAAAPEMPTMLTVVTRRAGYYWTRRSKMEVGDFVFNVDINITKIHVLCGWVYPASIYFTNPEKGFGIGVTPFGDVQFHSADVHIRSLDCMRRGTQMNHIKLVRQGGRFDGFVNCPISSLHGEPIPVTSILSHTRSSSGNCSTSGPRLLTTMVLTGR